MLRRIKRSNFRIIQTCKCRLMACLQSLKESSYNLQKGTCRIVYVIMGLICGPENGSLSRSWRSLYHILYTLRGRLLFTLTCFRHLPFHKWIGDQDIYVTNYGFVIMDSIPCSIWLIMRIWRKHIALNIIIWRPHHVKFICALIRGFIITSCYVEEHM